MTSQKTRGKLRGSSVVNMSEGPGGSTGGVLEADVGVEEDLPLLGVGGEVHCVVRGERSPTECESRDLSVRRFSQAVQRDRLRAYRSTERENVADLAESGSSETTAHVCRNGCGELVLPRPRRSREWVLTRCCLTEQDAENDEDRDRGVPLEQVYVLVPEEGHDQRQNRDDDDADALGERVRVGDRVEGACAGDSVDDTPPVSSVSSSPGAHILSTPRTHPMHAMQLRRTGTSHDELAR